MKNRVIKITGLYGDYLRGENSTHKLYVSSKSIEDTGNDDWVEVMSYVKQLTPFGEYPLGSKAIVNRISSKEGLMVLGDIESFKLESTYVDPETSETKTTSFSGNISE